MSDIKKIVSDERDFAKELKKLTSEEKAITLAYALGLQAGKTLAKEEKQPEHVARKF